jgi:hypothetical protein
VPSDLHAICEELRRIGLRPETPARREKLDQALLSKWDGVQVAAAKALSRWGDARSLRNLKELLADVAGKPVRWSTTDAVARLLTPHLQPSDLDWVIDIFIHRSRAENRFAVARLFEAFAPHEFRGRLSAQKLYGGKAERAVRDAIARAEERARTFTGSKKS